MGRVSGMQGFSSHGLIFGGEEISIPETHGPFGNCIPVRVNQVIKGIKISQWPSHRNKHFFTTSRQHQTYKNWAHFAYFH